MLTSRYRVVGLLGRGGMGEVYQADDLKLRQPVALKFLPPKLATNARKLERFHHEVRGARQVSHPNVCRVYDIGELDGHPFLPMEFIDGEDLASVLRRMGRPSPDKALQIARQLCAGLAAAHDKGVLHRDLKPHNVMIDGQGRVRVTDFGLAGFLEEFAGAEIGAGTPAYMAPEQLAGREVSVKSDIYSLGLVLFELFTGQRAFDGSTREQIDRLRTTSAPTSLTTTAQDVDPAVERVILRCLETEPSARPSSALAVAAALPGGDPLAAALAAGETPSPQMVANAGGAGGLRPRVAAACLVGILALMVTAVALAPTNHLRGFVPLPKTPQDLTFHTRDLLEDWGYDDHPPHQAHGFEAYDRYLKHVAKTDQSVDRWNHLATGQPPGMMFWYRHCPERMSPTELHGVSASSHDPPQSVPGSATVHLAPDGRLVRLAALPLEKPAQQAASGEFDFSRMFKQAGLTMADFTACQQVKAPAVPCDAVYSWKGPALGDGDEEIVVEAGAFQGKPTYFEIINTWDKPAEAEAAPTLVERVQEASFFIMFVSVIVGATLLARRNLKLGRSDRKGAFRLALFILVTMLVPHCLLGVPLRTVKLPELVMDLAFERPLGHALQHACLAWLLYIALEPYVRRLWPRTLVS